MVDSSEVCNAMLGMMVLVICFDQLVLTRLECAVILDVTI